MHKGECFLERIARSLKEQYGDLNRHCLVFPGRRAGLYMIRYLSEGLGKPIWAPAICTINDLLNSGTTLQTAGNEILLCELYKVYSVIHKKPESFDDFYFWGDMLLNDFDDADKYLVDTTALFSNIKDLKDIDLRFGNLNDYQRSVIKSFWTNFDGSKPTREKESFVSIWSILSDIYISFRNSLRSKNIAYEGMIFRDVAESADSINLISGSWDMIHFIGFNALNECEKKVMYALKKCGKARFYWDYDNSYLHGENYNTAGFFLRKNIDRFGNDMPGDWSYDTRLSEPAIRKNRRVVQTSSDIAQVKLIPELISSLPDINKDNAHQTAIILSDENLLMPLLTSLPDSGSDINITMGYPLKQSQVYTFTKMLMDLQVSAIESDGKPRFSGELIERLLKHPLLNKFIPADERAILDDIAGKVQWISSDQIIDLKVCSKLFTKFSGTSELSDWIREILSEIAVLQYDESNPVKTGLEKNLVNEFIYRIVLTLNRLDILNQAPEINISAETYLKIFDRLLKHQTVPFSGEPLSGIQIMGILETRALDFRNLVILSVNEGAMPATTSTSSFIPYSLREAFNLPSVNHQESIFAYHFYRLLHRAENVTFTYNSSSEGLRTGEMSRFLLQMNYNENLRPDFLSTGFEFKATTSPGECIERSSSHSEKLHSRFISGGKPLSPSAINTWLSCRMKFFFRYVNGLNEPVRKVTEIDPAMFGNILHDTMKRIYGEHLESIIAKELIDRILNDKGYLRETLDNAILENLRKGVEVPVSGNELIVRDVLLNFTKRILRTDRDIAPFKVLHLEKYFGFPLNIYTGGSTQTIMSGGYVDRIDVTGSTTRIVDYKTGSISESIKSIESLFEDDRKKDYDGWMQLLLYCEAFTRNTGISDNIEPFIYCVKKLTGKTFPGNLVIKQNKDEYCVSSYSTIRDYFMEGLNKTIVNIFDPDEPFTMTKDARNKCRYCPYNCLCSR